MVVGGGRVTRKSRLLSHGSLAAATTSAGVLVAGGAYLAWRTYGQTPLQSQQEKDCCDDDNNCPEYYRAQQPAVNHHRVGGLLAPGVVSQASSIMEEELQQISAETREDMRAKIPRHLRKPWRLLNQANTGSYEQHIKAVKDLSGLSLSAGDWCQLGQSCEMRTAVGLARTAGVDLRLFCRPPPLPPEVESKSIATLFKDVLAKLPPVKTGAEPDNCIDCFTKTALEQCIEREGEQLRDNDISQEFHRESHHIHSIPYRSNISEEKLIYSCLQALLAHSTIDTHCQHLLEALPVMTKILNQFPDQETYKSVIGKILANISLVRDHHRILFTSGWVGVLARWRQDQNVLVSLPAAQALANLDQDYGVHQFQSGVYLLLPTDRHVQHKNIRSNRGVDIVFLHGLLGGVFYTWRQQDKDNVYGPGSHQETGLDYSTCWPRDWLTELSDSVRVLAVDFDSHISQWGGSCPPQSLQSTLSERSESILSKLVSAGVGRRPVVFVGHSMGGLIIKKMLLLSENSENETERNLAHNTRGVVFYSTPHLGTSVAQMNSVFQYFFFPSVEVQELKPHNPELVQLNNDFRNFADKAKVSVVSFGETVPTPTPLGLDYVFVSSDSSDPGYGDFYSVNYNHMDICKPEHKRSILFRKFVNLVWDVLDQTCPS